MNDAAKDRPRKLTPPFSLTRIARGGLRVSRRLRRFSIAGLAAAAIVRAADDSKIIFPSGTPQASTPAASSVTSGASAFTLVIALLLAAVGAWFYWRNHKSPSAMRGTQNLAIEETRSLGNRQYLVVAAYGDEKFLLGVCPGRIDMLTPLGRQKEAAS